MKYLFYIIAILLAPLWIPLLFFMVLMGSDFEFRIGETLAPKKNGRKK